MFDEIMKIINCEDVTAIENAVREMERLVGLGNDKIKSLKDKQFYSECVDNEDDDVVVTLNLDDGSEVTCEILTIFDVNDQDYIVLLPLDKNGEPNEDGEVFIYRYFEDETGAPSLDNIESDEEYEAVSKRFDEICDEDFGE